MGAAGVGVPLPHQRARASLRWAGLRSSEGNRKRTCRAGRRRRVAVWPLRRRTGGGASTASGLQQMVLWPRLPPAKRSAPGLGVCAEQQATAPPYPGAPPPPPLEDAHQQSRASWAGLKPGPNGKWPGGSRRPKGNARYRALVYRLRARAREPWWAGPKSACFGRLSLDP